jgi:hypothetical protein
MAPLIESFPLGAANGTFPYYKLNRLTSANYDGRIIEYSYYSMDDIQPGNPPTPLVSRNETGLTVLVFVLYPCVGILTRLAAARMIASPGVVPRTIDEALGFSDPERLQQQMPTR